MLNNRNDYNFRHPNKIWSVGLLCLSVGLVYAGDVPDKPAQLGQKIYRDGKDDSQNKISVTLGKSSDLIPATAFPCANCHGLEGEGKQEGSLSVPPISITYLSAPAAKQTYDEAAFKRAITQGISIDNQPLSGAMPRYRLSEAQAKALWAYLKLLGTAQRNDQGVSDKAIKLAALLPLTGPLASTGNLLHETLSACLAEVNQQGLIYARKLVLAVQDSGNTKAEILAGVQRINNEIKPFVVLSSYLPEMTSELVSLFSQDSLPVIAPISFVIDEKTDINSPVFYFLPDHLTMARTLIEYWRTQIYQAQPSVKSKLTLIYRENTREINLANAILNVLTKDQKYSNSTLEISKFSNHITSAELIKSKPDAILLLGGNQELSVLKKNLNKSKQRPVLLGLLNMLAIDALQSYKDSFAKIILASPYAIQNDGFKRLADRLSQHAVKIENPGLQSLACASINLVAQTLKQTGKQLTRTKFIKTLEEASSFQTAITPPLSFSKSNHHGSSGAYLYTVSESLGTSMTQIGWFPLF